MNTNPLPALDPLATPADPAPSWVVPTGGDVGRSLWIASPIRVAELVFDATRTPTLRLRFDDRPESIAVEMRRVPTAGSCAPTLMVRPRAGTLDAEPSRVGEFVTLWFAKRDGFHAFRAEVLAELRNTLVVRTPEGILRHSRRGPQRYSLPAGDAPRLYLPLGGGRWRAALEVAEISTGGLSAVLTPLPTVAEGAELRVGLQVEGDRVTLVQVHVRHARRESDGTQRVGLEFVDLSRATRMNLERLFFRTKATPLPEVVANPPTALPEAVWLRLRGTPDGGERPAAVRAPGGR